jgi:hypothetical protein
VLDHGGNDALGLAGGLVASAAWSLVIYRLAIALRLPGDAPAPVRARVRPVLRAVEAS